MKRFRKLILCLLIMILILPNTTLLAANASVPLKIVIDPGHGGKDPGAIGVNGIYEKDVNLDIAFRLRDLLKAEGYEVIMTRETDQLLVDYTKSSEKYLDLQARVDIATKAGADLFVSIHANSFNSTTKGTMVLYYDPIKWNPTYAPTQAMIQWSSESKKLAQQIQTSITTQLGMKNLGIIPSNVYVVRSGTVPSVLVETAFLSNWEEAEKLKTPDFRQAMARAIKDGILQYTPVRYVDIIQHWAKDEISVLSNQGIIQGYTDNTFRPEKVLTRGELIRLLDKTNGFFKEQEMEGKVDPENKENVFPFTDVPADYWAYSSIVAAYQRGIIEGYEDATFRPNQKVTREEMTAILYRLYFENEDSEDFTQEEAIQEEVEQEEVEQEEVEQEEVNQEEVNQEEVEPIAVDQEELAQNDFSEKITPEVQFSDVPEDHWASKAIVELQSRGLIKGIKVDYFGLGQGIKRAEAAILIYRFLQNNLHAA